VGLREIIDIKHGGVEGFGIMCDYLGTSVPVDKLVDAAIELDADAIFASMIISHADIHRQNMRRIDQLCREKGIRDKIIFFTGGTQVTDEIAKEEGADSGFGRGSKGVHVASALVKTHRERFAQ
jgi:D-ornithine 4,5-aminomutase subunit beta